MPTFDLHNYFLQLMSKIVTLINCKIVSFKLNNNRVMLRSLVGVYENWIRSVSPLGLLL